MAVREAGSVCGIRPEHFKELRAAPNEHRTPVGYNKLWQLGLLELWLQTHGNS